MIHFDNVSFTYKGSKRGAALQNLQFHIKKGEVILICGGSGCGKSTVSRIMNGLIPHFYKGTLEGEVRIDGEACRDKTLYAINQHTGSVFQNPRTQFFNLDTDGELVFGCENRGVPVEDILHYREECIQRFDMTDLLQRNIYQMSGGQQQKVACASVYCTHPALYVLDEPTSNLDEAAIEELHHILKQIKAEGKTIVVAEHRLYFLMDLVDRVFYMADGHLVQIYSRDEFMALPAEALQQMGLRSRVKPQLKKQPQTIAEGTSCLAIKSLEVDYKDRMTGNRQRVALKDIRIPCNGIVALTGHNGIGKSTAVRTLAGLQKHAKAEIVFKGQPLSKRERLKACFLVMQDVNHQLFSESVLEELKLGMRQPSRERLEPILRQLSLYELRQAHPMDLSGGQKQRTAIAAALSSGKPILILDEPTSGLDYCQMQNVAQALQMAQAQVALILVVTHDVEFINSCCTDVIQL